MASWHKFYRTCQCGEEFLTAGAKTMCTNCQRKAKKVYTRPTWTPRPCEICGEPIPHLRSDGAIHYNLKKTCSTKCRLEYHRQHYKYWRKYENN